MFPSRLPPEAPDGVSAADAGPGRLSAWLWLPLFGFAYFLAVEGGHLLTAGGAPAATLSPAAGLHLAALLLAPMSRWPALVLVAFAVNFGADTLLHGRGGLLSAGFCVSRTAEALLGAALARRLARHEPRGAAEDHPRATLSFLLGAVMAGPALGATLGAGVAHGLADASFAQGWAAWWTGGALGILVLSPPLLALLRRPRAEARAVAEGLAIAAAAAALMAAALLFVPEPLAGAHYLVLPAIAWGAVRGGSPGVSAALAGAAATVAIAAGLDLRPLDTLAGLAGAQGFLLVAGATCHLLAATVAERSATRRRVEAVEARLRRAIDGAGMATFDTDHITGQGVWSRSRFEMLGLPPPPGLEGAAHTAMWRDRLHPEDREETLSRLAEARRTAKPYRTVHRILRADTGEVRWMEAHGRFLDPENGRMTRTGGHNVGVVFDITARVEAEERERLLLREVEHRAKNALQVARSLLHATPFADRESFVAALDARLGAMARGHTLLSGARWTGADLREIAMIELGHLVTDGAGEAPRISLEGPAGVRLRAEATQGLALVLQELAANAAKYGALSMQGGTVRLYWQAMPGGGASLRWSEQGGPPAGKPPARVGFGSGLIAATVRGQLGGTVEFRWRPEGLLVEIEIAAEHLDGSPSGQVPQKVR